MTERAPETSLDELFSAPESELSSGSKCEDEEAVSRNTMINGLSRETAMIFNGISNMTLRSETNTDLLNGKVTGSMKENSSMTDSKQNYTFANDTKQEKVEDPDDVSQFPLRRKGATQYENEVLNNGNSWHDPYKTANTHDPAAVDQGDSPNHSSSMVPLQPIPRPEMNRGRLGLEESSVGSSRTPSDPEEFDRRAVAKRAAAYAALECGPVRGYSPAESYRRAISSTLSPRRSDAEDVYLPPYEGMEIGPYSRSNTENRYSGDAHVEGSYNRSDDTSSRYSKDPQIEAQQTQDNISAAAQTESQQSQPDLQTGYNEGMYVTKLDGPTHVHEVRSPRPRGVLKKKSKGEKRRTRFFCF
ncbi:hypothetical protein BDV95DRAFT_612543 [Massariosphaeria phaeospora]|uniref:Uncharacterized protein n=1 Tax=Massariosphaeria phaeospora TaxID=100035 RepID=A0A7C8M151_9PLEO|nr:hypothetical protein BDV95DRAFT_612543 [Massariosphaeria phaeospora]